MFSYSCPNIAVKSKRVLSLLSFSLSFFYLFIYLIFFCKTMWKHLRTCVRLATRLKETFNVSNTIMYLILKYLMTPRKLFNLLNDDNNFLSM